MTRIRYATKAISTGGESARFPTLLGSKGGESVITHYSADESDVKKY